MIPRVMVMLILLFCYVIVPAYADENLNIDFSDGLTNQWETKELSRSRNRFAIKSEEGNKILQVYSHSSASGIFRKWRVDSVSSATIAWRWKVQRSLSSNKNERTKRGDDYAARVFVLFEPRFFRWRIPNVCYVWAGNEPSGSVFKSPYSNSVCMIVLQSGDAKSSEWMSEKRDLVADYTRCFGKKPEKISAVAILSDTDNTGGETTAWFDDLQLAASTQVVSRNP